ncbi:MAG: peptidoglycan DD-metalloendopeptidase family protein [Pleurocapsa sp. SU_5_0]|nr:peptidoglycan DD-metalloendopeptidase family protein [Pleurocapsa sp. SU_5_0]
MSSTMIVQTIGLYQPTYALKFNNPLRQQLSSAKTSFDYIQPQQKPAFVPKTFNLLAFSFKSQSTDFSGQSDKLKPTSTILSQVEQATPASNHQKSYLANAKSPATPLLIYQVKQGDTITKIASEHQVSSDELIELNQISNSNIIFVDQKLQIPTQMPTKEAQNNTLNSSSRAIANLTPTSNSNNSSQSNLNKMEKKSEKNVVSSADEDPYIANLRAEIDQLRAQYRQKQEANERTNSASLVSVTDQQTKPRAKSNPLPTSTLAKLNSPSPQRNLQSNLIKPDALALKLPPLSNSEEYLPNAFDGYIWPAEGVLTSGYGWRWGRMHQGIDIAAPIGTPVLAAASGTVIGAGWHDGYGYLIKLEHSDGSVTYYGHNNRILVTPGQQVEQGDQIAEMGSTGNSTGSHVHFEIRLSGETIVDPITLLSSR